jgi:hypothetical protein
MANRTLPKWKMSARTAGIASATGMILEENGKIQRNRDQEMMKKLSLHFAIIIRQRMKKHRQIQEKFGNLQHQGKYLEKNIKYRELRKIFEFGKN